MDLSDGTFGDEIQNVRTGAPEANDCDPLSGEASVDCADSCTATGCIRIFKRPIIAIDDACTECLRSHLRIELFRLNFDVLHVILNLREIVRIPVRCWTLERHRELGNSTIRK